MDEIQETKIGEIVRQAEDEFINGQTTISKYVSVSMSDELNKIDAYLNSKHISGETDNLEREKPFFNIVTAAVNVWYRATDIDRKNIKIKAGKLKDTITSFLATVHLQDWMRRNNFGMFLNDWGLSLARYGSSVIKMVEQDGELKSIVVPWNRLIVDSVDFDNNPIIEVLELTESQLRKREGYNQKIVEKLCDTISTRETTDKQKKDNKANYIKLYEVHGEFPLSYLTGKEKDEDTYVQQMHVISFVASKEEGKYDDFTLISGRETKNPYMITHLIKEEGQTLSYGAVRHLFEAQWMMNHTAKAIKDQLDLASKLIFQTSDGNFVGQNALSAIETGDILIHAVNQPLTQLANSSHDITSLQNFGSQWKSLANEITGISESMLGNTAPSGTAWRQVEALLQESHSLFELMTENKGLYVEQMIRNVISHLKKKMDTTKEVSATLEDYDLTRIDKMYVRNEATKKTNRALVEKVLNEEIVSPLDQQMMMDENQMALKEGLSDLGNQRFFKPSEVDDKTWKEVFKDMEWDVVVDVTGESVDKDAVTTLNTMLQTIAKNPMILQDPNAKLLFNKILNETAIVSPLEISSLPSPTAPKQPQPVG